MIVTAGGTPDGRNGHLPGSGMSPAGPDWLLFRAGAGFIRYSVDSPGGMRSRISRRGYLLESPQDHGMFPKGISLHRRLTEQVGAIHRAQVVCKGTFESGPQNGRQVAER